MTRDAMRASVTFLISWSFIPRFFLVIRLIVCVIWLICASVYPSHCFALFLKDYPNICMGGFRGMGWVAKLQLLVVCRWGLPCIPFWSVSTGDSCPSYILELHRRPLVVLSVTARESPQCTTSRCRPRRNLKFRSGMVLEFLWKVFLVPGWRELGSVLLLVARLWEVEMTDLHNRQFVFQVSDSLGSSSCSCASYPRVWCFLVFLVQLERVTLSKALWVSAHDWSGLSRAGWFRLFAVVLACNLAWTCLWNHLIVLCMRFVCSRCHFSLLKTFFSR